METYRITCREEVYFIKEVKADSEDEAMEKFEERMHKYNKFKYKKSRFLKSWKFKNFKN